MATLDEIFKSMKPETPLEHTLRYLTAMALTRNDPGDSVEAYLEQHGQAMKVTGPYPEELRGDPRHHQAKQCFYNAGMLVGSIPETWYCEGVAISPRTGFPVAHGWLCHRDLGVLDPTWPDQEGAFYFGVAFERVFKMSMSVLTGYSEMLYNARMYKELRIKSPFDLKKGEQVITLPPNLLWTPAEQAKKES